MGGGMAGVARIFKMAVIIKGIGKMIKRMARVFLY